MKFKRAGEMDKMLLAHDNPDNVYKADHRTCKAIIEPHGDELWIPFVARKERGDFKAFMDAMVKEFEHTRIRFIGTGKPDSEPEGAIKDLLQIIGPSDGQTIHEAVHGFETEKMEFEDGEAMTLVGEWQPE